MYICPDCRQELKNNSCANCDWSIKLFSKIPCYFKTKKPAFLEDYYKNYEKIADDDLAQSILPEEYLDYMATNTLKFLDLDSKMNICDLGSGKGYLCRALKARGAKNITAVDIDLSYLKRLSKDFKCIIADGENLPFKDEFDLITSTDVMEHVINLGSFLFCVNSALKKNGKFLVRVPFEENLIYYSPHMGCKYDFVHLRTFNKSLFVQTLEQNGFVVEKFFFDSYWKGREITFIQKLKKIPILGFFTSDLFFVLYKWLPKENYIKTDSFLRRLFCKIFMCPVEMGAVAKKISDING